MMNEKEFLTADDVSRLLKIKVNTLAEWRSLKTGPAYHKIGHRVRYSAKDIQDWVDSRKMNVKG